MTVSAQKVPDLARDQRDEARWKLRLEGRLFLPAEETTFDCIILDLSAGGAGLYCDEPPPLNSSVVLYVNGFGRFEGVATRYVKGELDLRFVCTDSKRKRLEEDLASYLKEGLLGITRLRRFQRTAPRAPIEHFVRTDGSVVPCELLDISLQGVSLRTSVHPPIGEVIALGATRAWVIRHFDDCIGVQFLQIPIAGAADGR
jgi:hypothetical protein